MALNSTVFALIAMKSRLVNFTSFSISVKLYFVYFNVMLVKNGSIMTLSYLLDVLVFCSKTL